MPSVLQTNPSAILQGIEDAIAAEAMALDPTDPTVLTTLDRSQVVWVAGSAEPPNLAGGRDVLLRYGVRLPQSAKEQGGGRLGIRFVFRLDVWARLAYAADAVGTNKEWLRRADAYADALLNLLLQLKPLDASGNGYTEEGLRIVGLSNPEKGNVQWGRFVGTFEVEYRPKIDETRDLNDQFAGR